jgi:hypothetical protein
MPALSATLLAMGIALVVQGCSGLIGGKEQAVGPAIVPGHAGRPEGPRGRPGVVIGAPEGPSDTGVDRVCRDLARLTGFGVVVANRPDTGAGQGDVESTRSSGQGADPAPLFAGARLDPSYQRQVQDAARGPLELYIEVRGDGRAERGPRVEIDTLGLSTEEAWQLKTLFELIRDARVDGRSVPRLPVGVEPAGPRAPTPGSVGSLIAPRRALRIDLPRLARTSYRQVYTELLGDFLVQSATILIPASR